MTFDRPDYKLRLSVWTEQQVDRLRLLCASPECGTTAWLARRINDEFGTDYTKNAVIGKMGRSKIAAPHPKGNNKPTERAAKIKRPKFNFAKPFSVPIVDNSPPTMPTEFPNKCSLLELTNETCRFPIGDPLAADFFFCGQPEADLSNKVPYCRAHARAAVSYRQSTGMSGN